MTLAIAVAGLVLSVISLALTAYLWRRSGPDLIVRFVPIPLDDWPAIEDRPARTGSHHVRRVEVISTGRLPVTVTAVEIRHFVVVGWFYAAVLGILRAGPFRRYYSAELFAAHHAERPVEGLPVTLAPSEVYVWDVVIEPHEKKKRARGYRARARAGGRWYNSDRCVYDHR